MRKIRTCLKGYLGSALGLSAKLLAVAAVVMVGRPTAATAAEPGARDSQHPSKGAHYDRVSYVQVGSIDRDDPQPPTPRPE
jgi:hypothetical protein